MARPVSLKINESKKELRKLLSMCEPIYAKRLRALVLLKEHEGSGISKRKAATVLGVDRGSFEKWRNTYRTGGLVALLSHHRVGNRPSDIAQHHEALREKLETPCNGLPGYVELHIWFNAEFGTKVDYKVLNNYVNRKFGASVKAARKSHVKRDPMKVMDFKKTSDSSATRR